MLRKYPCPKRQVWTELHRFAEFECIIPLSLSLINSQRVIFQQNALLCIPKLYPLYLPVSKLPLLNFWSSCFHIQDLGCSRCWTTLCLGVLFCAAFLRLLCVCGLSFPLCYHVSVAKQYKEGLRADSGQGM